MAPRIRLNHMTKVNRRQALSFGVAASCFAAMPKLALANASSVVATTGMIADAAKIIGGDNFDVKGLMGPGVDPHSYRQTRSDIVAIAQADLVLWHVLFLEAQMEELFRKLEGRLLLRHHRKEHKWCGLPSSRKRRVFPRR